MLARHVDPIVAIATAPGRGAVGIVRVSGKGLEPLVKALCGRALRPREATYLPFRDAQGQAIDQGLALYFPAPHSYTGEDVLELQAHGGPVVLQLLLARCLEAAQGTASASPVLPGLRVAQPGEFTERAFLNDTIDLAQAEAVADLISAGDARAARAARRSLDGVFSRRVDALADALLRLRIHVEAAIDFVDEPLDTLGGEALRRGLAQAAADLDALLREAERGRKLRDGLHAVIVGPPNAGKSSLLNALAGAELAIVTPIAGTTRDKVQQTIQIEGVPLHVIDTAGLRDSDDEVERIGIARAWSEIEGADAVLFLHDLSRMDQPDYLAADAAVTASMQQKIPASVPVIDVWNKTDCTSTAVAEAAGSGAVNRRSVRISARTGDGLEALRRILLEVAGWQSAPEGVYIARARHVQALAQVDAHLEQAAAQLLIPSPALDLLAEELRLAQNALGAITGEFSSDDLLGVIFSSFCIGK